MGKSLTRKIIESHFVSGDMTPGEEIFIKVDQTLTHDINAVMTYLAFEATGPAWSWFRPERSRKSTNPPPGSRSARSAWRFICARERR